MNTASKVNRELRKPLPDRLGPDTLRRLSAAHGFNSVAELARSIGRSRVTVWRAVRWPDQYGPTVRLLEDILL